MCRLKLKCAVAKPAILHDYLLLKQLWNINVRSRNKVDCPLIVLISFATVCKIKKNYNIYVFIF